MFLTSWWFIPSVVLAAWLVFLLGYEIGLKKGRATPADAHERGWRGKCVCCDCSVDRMENAGVYVWGAPQLPPVNGWPK